jgi:hypothetical protein
MSAVEKMAVAFEGNPSQQDIRAKLDRALTLYGTEISEENYNRAGSTLVALRKSTGVQEMAILDYMIRSYVPAVKVTFPEMAAMSATMIKSGDR